MSVLLCKKLPQQQGTAVFKYGIADYAYVHQNIRSLAETGI